MILLREWSRKSRGILVNLPNNRLNTAFCFLPRRRRFLIVFTSSIIIDIIMLGSRKWYVCLHFWPSKFKIFKGSSRKSKGLINSCFLSSRIVNIQRSIFTIKLCQTLPSIQINLVISAAIILKWIEPWWLSKVGREVLFTIYRVAIRGINSLSRLNKILQSILNNFTT